MKLSSLSYFVKTNSKGQFTFAGVTRGTHTLDVWDKSPVYRDKTTAIKVRGDMKGIRVKVKG